MADIPLRTYLQQVDHHIEQKQFDEAISHCKHILTHYPKNIETYRLLGKALLEKGRHGDAADIFQRVLSAMPDDFVSHVGMAIVREDESNLEAALWHMERAFENSPANAAVQEELRRLYGRRDGVVPPRARLTRGGLARLYARGDLFTQAESELRAALADDPERLDLRALLARVLAENGRRAEAAEVASAVLQKLPYNQEANRLLAGLLMAQNRAEEARPYQQRLEALDPYERFTDGPLAPPVRDDAVRVPLLAYDPDRQTAASPDWAESLGADLESVTPAVSAEEPDWLRLGTELLAVQTGALTTGTSALTGGLDEPLTGELPEPGEVPDWMRDVEPVSAPVSTDLPDWMKATTGVMAGPSPETEETPKKTGHPTGWLTQELAITALGKPATMPISEEEVPDWLKDIAPPPSAPSEPSLTEMLGDWRPTAPIADEGPTARLAGDLPDWLKTGGLDVSAPYRPAEGDPTRRLGPDEPTQVLSDDELPAWLKNIPPATGTVPAEDMPDWLKPATPTNLDELPPWLTAVGGTAAAAGAEALPLPEWLEAVPPEKPATPPEAAAAETPLTPPAVELPDFLQPASPEAIARANAPVDWDSSPTMPDEPIEEEAIEVGEVPDWVKAMAPADSAPPAASAADLPPIALEEAPDWLRTPPEVAQPSAEAAEEPTAPPTSDVPAWAEPTPPGASETIAGWLRTKDMPDWLREIRAQARGEEKAVKPATVEQPVAGVELPPGEPTLPEWVAGVPEQPAASVTAVPDVGALSDDEAMRWLESLAARQGADPAELTTTAEERAAFVAPEVPTAGPAAAEPVAAEPAAAEEMPDWLKAMVAPAEAEITPSPVEPAVAEAPAPSAAAAPDLSEMSADDALRWLESLAARQGADPAELTTTAEERAAFVVPPKSEITPPAWTLPEEPAPSAEAPRFIEDAAELEEPSGPLMPPTGTLPDIFGVTEAIEAETPAPPAAVPDFSTLSDDEAMRWLESLAARQGVDPAELTTRPEERPDRPPIWIVAESETPLPAEEAPSAVAKPPTSAMPDWATGVQAEQAAASVEPTLPTAVVPPAEPAAAQPIDEDEAMRWLESLAARPAPVAEELRSLVAEPEQPLVEEPAPEPVIEPPDWVKAPPAAPAPPSPEPTAASTLSGDDRLARLAERLSASRRAKEQEVAERLERERAEREAAQREIQQRMEERRARRAEIGTGTLRRRTDTLSTAAPETAPTPPPAAEPAKPEPTPLAARPPAMRLPTAARLTRRPRKSRKSAFAGQTHTAVLSQAQSALQSSEPAEAQARFEHLIRSGHKLDEVIVELEAYLARNPDAPIFLRLLGDAYMRAGRLQKALDAYREALVKM